MQERHGIFCMWTLPETMTIYCAFCVMKCHARVICKQFGEIEALRMDKDPAWQGGNNCNLQLGGGFKYC